MDARSRINRKLAGKLARVGAALVLSLAAGTGLCAAENAEGSPQVLDRVVAVVNNHAILASDIADALRYSILDPQPGNGDSLTAQRALHQLISRSLIQQQIREEDVSEPTDEQVQVRIAQIRRDLPVCVRENCANDLGWSAFLIKHGLTNAEVERYERLRMEILGFIETRFRQGIRISDEDTETYYREKLLPQYAKGAKVPPLVEVSPRIQEILLQQQVNAMFSSWLDSLRKQGDVEVLDPSLEPSAGSQNGDEDDQ
jgi:peptidyl-prolyl cis-trans isomerase SurA